MAEQLIQMSHISKEFPGVKALDDVSFELNQGEVHALVGENGAGKSTLMKILTGVYQADKGEILIQGAKATIESVRDSQKHGVIMIHQELNLMNHLTVAQNIFIGREEKGKFPLFLDDSELNRKASEIFKRLNVNINPTDKVGDLTVAKQQMVEIAKALSYDPKVLIMDEPTAALTDAEIEDLFRVIRVLRSEGKGIIHISHRLEELKQISDRITVMRDGQYVDTVATKDVSLDEIISMMVGRVIYVEKPTNNMKPDAPVALEVKNLSCAGFVHDVSFKIHEGEILGFSGLMGAGRTEVARAIFGADPMSSGEVYVRGKKVTVKDPASSIQHGLAYLSEDRKRYGLALGLDVEFNTAMAHLPSFTGPLGFMKQKNIEKNAEEKAELLAIKTPSTKQLVKFLSGGNMQKVVLAKWLTRDCDIIIFDEPTRGIDVGAKSEIYKLINDLAASGKAIIIISSELPEILRISNRVVVMCEGAITGELTGDEITQENIMHYATQRDMK